MINAIYSKNNVLGHLASIVHIETNKDQLMNITRSNYNQHDVDKDNSSFIWFYSVLITDDLSFLNIDHHY